MSNSHVSLVRNTVQRLLDNGNIANVRGVVQAVLEEKCDIYGDDLPFYQQFTVEEIKRQAKSAIARFKPKPETDPQLVLKGFEHLQIAYPVVRNGEALLVPTGQCSDIELLGRAKEYRQMSKGCLKHARELEELVADRTPQAA